MYSKYTRTFIAHLSVAALGTGEQINNITESKHDDSCIMDVLGLTWK